MTKRISAALLLLFALLLQGANAQKELTFDDQFNGTYSAKGFGPVRWIDGGKGYTALEASKDSKGRDIVRYESSTGVRAVLVTASDLVPEGKQTPLAISDYIWSDDGSQLMIFTNTQRVWRYNTRGEYWVLDLKTKKLKQLGIGLKPQSLMFAKFSPDGLYVAYVSEQNLYVEHLEKGTQRALTTDGGGHIINGTFDWVYEEELDCRDGFRWSPDSRNIAFWQLDTEGIGTFYMINNLDSIYPKLIPIPYPKVGTTNPAAKVGVVSVLGGAPRFFNISGDPRNHYLARMEFAASSKEVMIQQLNRLQNTNRVMMGDIHTMEVKTILTETDKAFLDIRDDTEWMQEGKFFTWSSERSGWMHLYVVSRDGSQIRDVTPGDFDVVDIQRIDQKGGYVYFIACPENPIQRYLYRSKLDGKGKPERISPAGQPGQHSYLISPDAKFAIQTYSNVTTPTTISLVSLPAHKLVRALENNDQLKQRFAALKIRPKEFFRVPVEAGVELDCYMIKPFDFDPSKKYPVIFNIYGEPAGATVQDNWGGGDLYNQYLAQKGYIIMSVDNRGTKTPRGREWRKSIYRQIGILAAQDQAAAARAIIDRYKFVDPARIGVYGWSGGGSMTLNCMFRYPSIYKTGIAIAFISNQKFYDTIYQERYMGLPDDNEEGYREGSPVTHAKNLEGNLLLIHGSGDDNCHYQSCEVLVDELIKHQKVFSMMEYPMRSHGIYEREGTSTQLRLLWTSWWLDKLPAGPR
jgi:dipeptidyl-peptidase-4